MSHPSQRTGPDQPRDLLQGVERACAGAALFSLPLMMTMEMWWLGFHMEPLRLALLLAVSFPLLIGVSHFAGFEPTFGLIDDLRDVGIAWVVGFTVPALVMLLFGVFGRQITVDDAVGKVALQAVPGSLGALLARSQLGSGGDRPELQQVPYFGELFLMVVGALFLAWNVAPTDEVALIAYYMTPWQALGLMGLSLAAMHAFVYAASFKGQESVKAGESALTHFLRFTVVGYVLVLLVCLYVIWTFGRTEGLAPYLMLQTAVVLSLPGAIGAAAARLVL